MVPAPTSTASLGVLAFGSDTTIMPGAVAVCCACTGSGAPGWVMSKVYTPVGASTAYVIEPNAATSRA